MYDVNDTYDSTVKIRPEDFLLGWF